MSPEAKDPVDLLAKLVAFRSDVDGGDERPLAEHLGRLLAERKADDVRICDVPRDNGKKPSSYVYARFGTPKLLLNVHLDTVPPNDAWSTDPFAPAVKGDRLYALGAADTKGASAAILAALSDVTPRDVGILFSGDEEFSGVAIRAFVESDLRQGLERAIVCEPTNLALGTRHRGFTVFEVEVSGPGGHSSKADDLPSPVGMLARLAVALDDWAAQQKPLGPPGFPGMCVNLAQLEGGIAFNVIPARGKLVVSIRPPPGTDTPRVLAELEGLARSIVPSGRFAVTRDNKPFATRDLAAFEALLAAGGAGARPAVDLGFWTEAAVLSAAGIDAVVLGTGDIAQAHGPDEWVPIAELAEARALFRGVFERSRG
ncbi:MAG: Acetylornithine deacetylase [Labilithrix sp.]|nr:Acetylornithine deacetylase [Labilithrix sp.]